MGERAPFRATITFDVWAWERADAQHVLDQLLSLFARTPTAVRTGYAVHHDFVSSSLAVAERPPSIRTMADGRDE